MLTIKSILCPVDFSDFSVRAYDYAQSLAEHYQASVSILHVVRPLEAQYPYGGANNIFSRVSPKLEDFAEDEIKRFAHQRTRAGLKPAVCARVGPVRKTILEVAAEKEADLITMGTHGHSEGTRGLLGSVTEYVLRHASCPVLAVRGPRHDFIGRGEKGYEAVRIRKILFCTDLSPFSERALHYALSLATEYAAELTLLYVIEDLKHDIEKETAHVKSEMERTIPKDVDRLCPMKSVVRVGKAYEQIVKYEAETDADLIVMGIHGRNVVDLALSGSTTHRVLQLGMCPVITVAVDKLAKELEEQVARVA
jgi:nucleotide-binding universal stress UspA family protein